MDGKAAEVQGHPRITPVESKDLLSPERGSSYPIQGRFGRVMGSEDPTSWELGAASILPRAGRCLGHVGGWPRNFDLLIRCIARGGIDIVDPNRYAVPLVATFVARRRPDQTSSGIRLCRIRPVHLRKERFRYHRHRPPEGWWLSPIPGSCPSHLFEPFETLLCSTRLNESETFSIHSASLRRACSILAIHTVLAIRSARYKTLAQEESE
jgi:hypothetical protein